MAVWNEVPFEELLIESRDGEWGVGEPTVGYQLCEIIRGTDFASLHSSGVQLPKRWIPDHIVSRKKLRAGDILLETAGGTATQSTGRSALLTNAFFERHNKFPVLCASFSRHLRLNEVKFDPGFIYYLLQALYSAGYMAVYNLQHTGVARFQYTSFKKKTVLNISDKSTQLKISATLSAYDDLIEKNRLRIERLEQMAEEIYREWFVRFRFPGYQKGKLEKGAPVGWDNAEAQKFFHYVKGKSYKGSELSNKETDMPFVTLKSLKRGGGYREEGLKKYSGRYRPEQVANDGDIIMAVTDMTQEREVVGRVARISNVGSRGAVISLDIIKLIPREISSSFLYSYLRLSGFGRYIKEFANGANVLHLAPEIIMKQKIIMPPEHLRDKFCNLVDPIHEKLDALSNACKLLKSHRDILLSRLVSGNLSLDQLDIKFPFSMREANEARQEVVHA